MWLAFRRSEWAWFAAAVLMFVAPPRVATSYLAFVLVAVELQEQQAAKSYPRGEAGTAVPRPEESRRTRFEGCYPPFVYGKSPCAAIL